MPISHAETPGQRLTPEEVAGLKHQLSEDPTLAKLVCGLAVVKKLGRSSEERPGQKYTNAQKVGVMAIRCQEDLQKGLAMRNDEWPADSVVSPGELNLSLDLILAGGQSG